MKTKFTDWFNNLTKEAQAIVVAAIIALGGTLLTVTTLIIIEYHKDYSGRGGGGTTVIVNPLPEPIIPPLDSPPINEPVPYINLDGADYDYIAEYHAATNLAYPLNLNSMDDLAKKCFGLDHYRNSMLSYYWLFHQQTSSQRKDQIIRDFIYSNEFWEFSVDFMHDVKNHFVRAIIISENEVLETTTGGIKLGLYQEVLVLDRSDEREKIGDISPYRYYIRTDSGKEGWLSGRHLLFVPNFKL